MKIYISIPITDKGIEEQKRKVREAERYIYSCGHLPISPFDVHAPEGLSAKEQYAYYMGQDIEMLLNCDAILMAALDWQKSKGCSIEHTAAYVMGMDIFYRMEDVPNGNKG